MPRRSNRKQLNITVTTEQYALTKRLAGAEGLNAYLRRLVAEDAQRRGVCWPDNLPEPGKYTREK